MPLKRQWELTELLDGEDLSHSERVRMLAALRRANVISCSYPPIIGAVSRLLEARAAPRAAHPIRIADVGAGTGDLARAIAAWGRRRGLPLEVVGIEKDAVAASEACRLSAGFPEVSFEHADFAEVANDELFEVVTALHLLHHFNDEQAVAALRRMAEIARVGIVVSDLHRSRRTYVLGCLLVRLASRCAPFRHDACVSILRSFTHEEFRELAQRAQLKNPRVTTVLGRRLLLTATGAAG